MDGSTVRLSLKYGKVELVLDTTAFKLLADYRSFPRCDMNGRYDSISVVSCPGLHANDKLGMQKITTIDHFTAGNSSPCLLISVNGSHNVLNIEHHPNMNFQNPKTRFYLHEIEKIVIGLLQGNPPTIVIKNYKKWENLKFTDRLTVKSDNVSEKCIHLCHKQHMTTFMVVIRLLAKIYKLLLTNSCVTKRELYYEEVEIIRCQKTVEAAVQIICHLLDCPPWEIGIMATSKGLVKGPLLIKSTNNDIIDCSSPGGTLIPFVVCSSSVELRSSAKYVLLIEKDATFQRLLGENIFMKMENILLITGKGFPDVNTRMLVRKLNINLKLPVLALVDADPSGIAIMCVYRYGSLNMSRFSKVLATPNIKWLGVHPTDIDKYNLQTIPLSQPDLSRIQSLNKLIKLMPSNQELEKQLQFLLQNGKKAEIEAVCNISTNYLSDIYIPDKIIHNKLY